MTAEDLELLEFIGRQGKTREQLVERFPGLDIDRLIDAGLVEIRRIELHETHPPGAPTTPDILFIVLTLRGAEAVGIDPVTLHAA